MDTVKLYLYVSAALFGVVALIHVVRAIAGWTFLVGPMEVPISASWIGFAITGTLAVWSIRLAMARRVP